MKKVITVNLNGRDYKLEEEGYVVLQKYLEQAEKRLKGNPDKDEILSDFEQAIADKCDEYLSEHKTVVTVAEIAKIIKDMGSVETSGETTSQEDTENTEQPRKKLYQIKEGAWISGVCNGLAAYFDVDVAIVRIIFVILFFITHGAAVLLYVIMMFVIPWAKTPEQKAQARGESFSADEFFKKSSAKYEEFRAKHILPESISQEQFVENWRLVHHWGNRIGAICIGFIAGLLIWGWVLALIALFTSGAVLEFNLGDVWVTALYITSIFFLLFWPLKLWIRTTLVSAGVYKKELRKSEEIINVLGWIGWTLSIIVFAVLSINDSSTIANWFSHSTAFHGHPIHYYYRY